MTPGEPTRDFYRMQGAEAERERIINLLEKAIPVCEPQNSDATYCSMGDCDCAIEQGNIEDLIELIKESAHEGHA